MAVVGRSPAVGLLRAVRAVVLTVPACGGALLAHDAGGGCLNVTGTLTAVALCWSSAVLILGRQVRASLLLAWMIAAQVVTHLLLSLTCVAVQDGRESVLGHLANVVSLGMLLAHGLLAVLTACGLARADAGLWTAHALLRALRRLAPPPLLEPDVPTDRARFRPDPHVEPVPTGLLVLQLPARRGPPRGIAA